MNSLPLYISIVFALTIASGLYIFYRARRSHNLVIYLLSAWLLIQAVLATEGFYRVIRPGVPRFMLLILPPLVCIGLIFSSRKGRIYTEQLDLKWLTLLCTLRLPAEIVLFWLFIHQGVPRIMTFEGRNPDILVGLTAPFICYFGFVRFRLPIKFILAWNLIGVALLLNIVVIAVLSMPFSTQQFGFNQPNIALFYFPFVWLPGFLVPLVMFAHLVSIRQLLIRNAVVLKVKSSSQNKVL